MYLLFPLVLSFPAYSILRRTQFFGHLNRLEKFVLTLATSISAVNLSLAYIGQFSPIGIEIPFLVIFFLCIASILLSFKQLVSGAILMLEKLLEIKNKILIIFLIALLAKVTVFYILHPVIDPDIVSNYLTFARSIVLTGRTPSLDLFTLSPSTTPPVGGSILFSLYYVVEGNTLGEGFILYTYPFFLGLLSLTYLISKKLFSSSTYALLSVVLFLSIPLIDTLLLEWTLYPDIMAAFLQLTVIYFLLFKEKIRQRASAYLIHAILGLSLAESILLKSQSILFLAMLAVLILIKGRFFQMRTYMAGLVAFAVLFFLPVSNSFGLNFFRLGENNILVTSLILIPVLVVLLAAGRYKKPALEIDLKSVLLVVSSTLLGFLWLGRNYVLYKNFLSVGDVEVFKDIIFQYRIFIDEAAENIAVKNSQTFNATALLTLPVFGSFLLIPKLVGIFGAIRKSVYWNTALFITLFWYALVIIYSGFPNERYLLTILPFLSMLAVLGVREIQARLFRNSSAGKAELFSLTVVVVYALLSLSQSLLLTWGFGSLTFSSSEIRNILHSTYQNTFFASDSGNRWLGFDSLISTIKLLNIRLGTFSHKDVIPATWVFGVLSFVILAFAAAVFRLVSVKFIKRLLFLSPIFLISPYVLLILSTSGLSVNNFPRKLEQSLYNYWGEANVIVPYLKDQAGSSSVILAVGPQTGLSYKLNRKVYNIQYGYGFLKLLPIIKERDYSVFYDFFVANNIEYVLVYEGRDNSEYLVNFGNNSPLYGFIRDKKFFASIITPDENNLWRLYKLIR